VAGRYDGIGQLQATLAQKSLAHAVVMWMSTLLWHEVLPLLWRPCVPNRSPADSMLSISPRPIID
jgi:hypothetical protein